MSNEKATRGYGLLEGYLAKKRAHVANKLIQNNCRQGKILDIGSGSYPLFLINTEFSEKYGIDQLSGNCNFKGNIRLTNHNIEKNQSLPFEDNFFDVITMLAVIEHIERKNAINLLSHIERILKPGGSFILTTPSAWTGKLLKLMAILKLVSSDELDEHKVAYSHDTLFSCLVDAGFEKDSIKCGFFEICMNQWIVAIKK